MRWLGVDPGEARVGLAICDAEERVAVRLHDRKHVENVTSFDDDPPIHVHFTKAKARVPDDRILRLRVDDAD